MDAWHLVSTQLLPFSSSFVLLGTAVALEQDLEGYWLAFCMAPRGEREARGATVH